MQPIFTVVNLGVIGFLLYSILVYNEQYSRGSLIFLAAALCVLSFTMINFAVLNIRVTETALDFGFGLFKRSFFIKNLVEVEIQKYEFRRFGGYGIRKSLTGETGFVARGGSGVYFRDTNSGKKVYLSSDKPEELYTKLIENGAMEKR
ncbi:TPA: hypothetical protein DF272_06305 [Candidatus Falkowbacteria bacterium]|nr:hypothetical protein [Candidatus Falkowbacteria bacterium]